VLRRISLSDGNGKEAFVTSHPFFVVLALSAGMKIGYKYHRGATATSQHRGHTRDESNGD
jgi:hypothetical protein